MKYLKSFSLSLQKHFSAKPRVLDFDFRMAFKHLKIGSLLYSCGIFKEKGIDTMTLLLWIVLVPFLKKPMTSLWLSKHVAKELDAKKDTYSKLHSNKY
jgi:hypothetical protein